MNLKIINVGRVKGKPQSAQTISTMEEMVIISKPYLFGTGMVLLMTLIYIFTWAGLFFGIKPGITGLGLAAAVLTILASFVLHGRSIKRLSVAVVAPLFVLVIAGLGAVRILDSSFDGLAYHQSAVLALQNGWKPFIDGFLGTTLWENHYPKASWIVGATLSNLFHSVEAMKAQNVAFVPAAFCLALAAIRVCLPRLQHSTAVLFSFVVAANPVSLYQLMTGYNDGLMASQITCSIALAIIAAKTRDKTSVLALALLLPYIINLKFTALVYVAVLWIGMIAILVGWRRMDVARFLIVPTVAACLAGIFVFGGDPYVTNFLTHGHPFYPIQGSGKVDIMVHNLPSAFIGKSYIYKLFAGLFGVPDWAGKEQIAISIIPRLWYFLAFRGYDVRIGGFGPVLCAVTAMLAAGLLACGRFTVQQRKIIAIASAIIVSGLINPEAWWARYVPQLWLAFAGFALVLITPPPSRTFARWLGATVLSVMALNSLGIAAIAGASVLERDREWRAALSKLAVQSNSAKLRVYLGTHSATWARLDSFGVRYSLVADANDCVDGVLLLPPPVSHLSTAKICGKKVSQ